MRVARRAADALLRQRGHLLLWAPCAFGGGVAWYFSLLREPSGAYLALLAAGLGLCGLLAWRLPVSAAPLAWAAGLVICGFLWALLRAHIVAAPVPEWRYYGPVEGRIIAVDRSASGAPRLLLDDLDLPRLRRAPPERVRISLHGAQPSLHPGQRVSLTANISPPGAPVEPGAFDFQRHAWFARLGGVGYSRGDVTLLAEAERLWLTRTRFALAQQMQARLPGAAGGVAAAITAGERGLIPPDVTQHLRHSNLSHLLAISGLHMGLLTGVVFTALRSFLSLFSGLALRFDARKIAAAGAIAAGAAYLLLSGYAVATERAFIMVLVFFGAVFLDRRALTLRAVAVAAFLVLLRRPEALIGAGFQMSFAATVALVTVFGQLQGRSGRNPVLGVLLSSFIAGAATAPFAALHFNIMAAYGLLANMLSVPVMGAVVMPSFVMAALLAPLGIEALPLWIAEQGLTWILAVARGVAALPGAVRHVPMAPAAVLPLMTCGALWLVLWRGAARWAGVVPLLLALALWAGARRPDLLIASSGGLVGIMTEQGRALSKPRGDGFAARVWLENDGDAADQAQAAARPAWQAEGRGRRATLGDFDLLLVTGKKSAGAVEGCGGADIFVTNIRDTKARPCRAFDQSRLTQLGAVAIQLAPEGLRITHTRPSLGLRLWNSPDLRARFR